MNLKKETRFKCDFCHNQGEYAFTTHLEIVGDLVFCDNCLKDMYKEAGKVIIPKSPENIILKNQKRLKGEHKIDEE